MEKKFNIGDVVDFTGTTGWNSKGVVKGYHHGPTTVTVEFEKVTPNHDARCDRYGKPGHTWFVSQSRLKLVTSILQSWD